MPDSLDYSFSRPTSPQALAAQGIKLVSRYLSNPPNSKNLTGAEAAGLHAAGIGVLLNWESSAGRPLGGAVNGSSDGKAAASYAESINAPHGLTIYYSCDTDTMSSQWPTIAAYYRAAGQATTGRYLVGVYGEADLVDYLHAQGVVTSEWQTYAWSNGRVSAQADLYQYLNGQQMAGAQVDFDRIIHPDQLGAWWPNGVAPAGGGTPITPPGDDMPLSADDKAWITKQINDGVINVLRSPEYITQILPKLLATPVDPHNVNGQDMAPNAAWPPAATLLTYLVDTEVRVGALGEAVAALSTGTVGPPSPAPKYTGTATFELTPEASA